MSVVRFYSHVKFIIKNGTIQTHFFLNDFCDKILCNCLRMNLFRCKIFIRLNVNLLKNFYCNSRTIKTSLLKKLILCISNLKVIFINLNFYLIVYSIGRRKREKNKIAIECKTDVTWKSKLCYNTGPEEMFKRVRQTQENAPPCVENVQNQIEENSKTEQVLRNITHVMQLADAISIFRYLKLGIHSTDQTLI